MGIMNIFAFQILGAAILMMLYACAVPLSEERRGGRGYEMLRGVGNMMQNGPGDEEERDCPCLDCWDPCIHFGVEEERGGGNEIQRGEGGGREGGYAMQRRGGGKGIVGCDLDNKLQEGGWLELVDEC